LRRDGLYGRVGSSARYQLGLQALVWERRRAGLVEKAGTRAVYPTRDHHLFGRPRCEGELAGDRAKTEQKRVVLEDVVGWKRPLIDVLAEPANAPESIIRRELQDLWTVIVARTDDRTDPVCERRVVAGSNDRNESTGREAVPGGLVGGARRRRCDRLRFDLAITERVAYPPELRAGRVRQSGRVCDLLTLGVGYQAPGNAEEKRVTRHDRDRTGSVCRFKPTVVWVWKPTNPIDYGGRMRGVFGCVLLLEICVLPTACFYADPIAGDEDTRFYDGTCRCILCNEPGTPPDFCNGPTTIDDAPAEFCHIDILDSLAVSKLTALCKEREDALNQLGPIVASCGLIAVNDSTDQFARLVNRGVERGVCALADRDRDPIGAPGGSRATLSSQIRATGSSLSAVADVTGEVEFYGGNCRTGTCPIQIMWLKLTGPTASVTVSGTTKTVRDTITVNQTVGTGTCTSLAPAFDACGFQLDPGSMNLLVSAFNPDDNERQLVYATSTDTGGGFLSFNNRKIAVTQTFSGNGTTVEFFLTGDVDNFAPHVEAPAPLTVSCGRGVQIPALIEDVDDPLSTLEVSWLVDGVIVEHGPGPLVRDLDPGVHLITILARDRHGAVARDSTVVTVAADTTPPTLADPSLLCLWPPDHTLDVATAADLRSLAADECDPAPQIVFLGGHSSQPDNGTGDGNTTDDLIVHADSVCARSERTGTVAEGRTYEVTMVAVDSAGNTSAPATLTINAPHDGADHSACSVIGGQSVPEDDARCVPGSGLPPTPVRAPGPTNEATSAGSGCATGEGRTSWLVVAMIALGLVRRGRRR
jgi:hypothetical protein